MNIEYFVVSSLNSQKNNTFELSDCTVNEKKLGDIVKEK